MQPRPLELARTLRARSKRRPKDVLSFLLQVARSGRIFEGSQNYAREARGTERGNEGKRGGTGVGNYGQNRTVLSMLKYVREIQN